MKNIHLLPTDKPSRLLKTIPKSNLILAKENTIGSHWQNQNIYITSDEEIGEGDWYLDTTVNVIFKNDKLFLNGTGYKKIILSTDPELIAYGVQAIDDEFLEWFVKNPSCEEVEVVSAKTIPALQLTGNGHCWWKIIIPKEETKQGTMSEAIKQVISNQLKQETLEEDDLDSIENKIIECLNKADNKLNANDFNRLAESIIDYIDEISRNKSC
jgi:hypothetical protein